MREGGTSIDSGERCKLQFKTLDRVIQNAAAALGLEMENMFPRAQRVDYRRFKTEIFPRVLEGRRAGADALLLDPLVVWTTLRSFVKGSLEVALGVNRRGERCAERVGKYLDKDMFLDFGKDRVRLSDERRHEAHDLALSCIKEYSNHHLWDNGDLVLAIHRELTSATLTEQRKGNFETACIFDKVYVDEVQDLTNAELVLLLKMSASGILFLAGDPAQSVEEGVDFRFDEVRRIFYHLSPKSTPTAKPLILSLNFRSHTGILEAAGVLLEWLFKYFPGSCQRLEADEGLCKGPRPGHAWMKIADVVEDWKDSGLV
jgi:hypothetical protein